VILYYVKQFGLYYGGKDASGAIVFGNALDTGVPVTNKRAAEELVRELGGDCEIEERAFGYKVPWRAYYADTFSGWLKGCWTCFYTTWRHRIRHWWVGVPVEDCNPNCPHL
jgi:hypothetical protein